MEKMQNIGELSLLMMTVRTEPETLDGHLIGPSCDLRACKVYRVLALEPRAARLSPSEGRPD